MKIIFIAFVACFTLKASAQVDTGLLRNQVKQFNPGGLTDSSLHRLTFATQALKPGIILKDFRTIPLAAPAEEANSITVYSRMPKAQLDRQDNMPVAKVSPMGFHMLTKRVIVINPLSTPVPAIINP